MKPFLSNPVFFSSRGRRRPPGPGEQTPSGAAELLSPFSCFYLEPLRAYPLKVLDFVRAVIVSVQPGAALGHASRLRCAAGSTEEQGRTWASQRRRWTGSENLREGVGEEFHWEEKKTNRKWTFVS